MHMQWIVAQVADSHADSPVAAHRCRTAPRGRRRGRAVARGATLLLGAVVLCSTVAGCCCPRKGDSDRSREWAVGMHSTGRPHDATTRTMIRRGPRVFTLKKEEVLKPGEIITAIDDAKVLLGMETPFVTESNHTKRKTIWNGLLDGGTIKVGGEANEGSVQFMTAGGGYCGTLYVEAASATAIPPGGSTVTQLAFPIVVTTSGGIGAGSVGTAWCCVVYEHPHADDPKHGLHGHWFVLLDNPGEDPHDLLYVAKGDCWAVLPTACERKVLHDAGRYIRVVDTTISAPALLSTAPSDIREAVKAAKSLAEDAGLRTP